jgi:hypothetical protein
MLLPYAVHLLLTLIVRPPAFASPVVRWHYKKVRSANVLRGRIEVNGKTAYHGVLIPVSITDWITSKTVQLMPVHS